MWMAEERLWVWNGHKNPWIPVMTTSCKWFSSLPLSPIIYLTWLQQNKSYYVTKHHSVFAHFCSSHIMLNMYDHGHHFQIRTLANISSFLFCSSSLYSTDNNPLEGATLSLPLDECLLPLCKQRQKHLARKKVKKLFHMDDTFYIRLTIKR
jgi:hypothetical protein